MYSWLKSETPLAGFDQISKGGNVHIYKPMRFTHSFKVYPERRSIIPSS